MNWRVRHQGSPESVERPLAVLEQELVDGAWETTDEIQPPGETGWQSFDTHPHFSEVCEELETPPKPAAEGEAHLDMNALIDVTMVLLIFFILTTSMAALQNRIEAPSTNKNKAKKSFVTREQIAENMIHVKATTEGDDVVITIEDKKVELEKLVSEMRKFVASKRRTTMLLEFDEKTTQDVVVQIMDKSLEAGIEHVQMLVP